jgi:PAP2 superfamily.
MLYIQKEKFAHKIFKISVHIIGIMIILSTMFLKQHYFVDVVLGATLGYALYYIFEYKVFSRKRNITK